MSEKMPGSHFTVKTEKESFSELLPEFQVPRESSETMQASQNARTEREVVDREEANKVLEKLTASAHRPPTADPAYEETINKVRTVSAQNFALRAEERNKRRPLFKKLFGRGKVTAQDMAREDAKATYVKISNLKRSPGFYGNGKQGIEYNSMASAMRKGARESELSKVAAEANPAHSRGRGWVESFAKHDAESVEWEKQQRRKEGLPTDVLDRDVAFGKAQEWEQKQREQNEKRAA